MMSQTGRRNSRRAFTLIEVLVAVVVLSVGIVSVLCTYQVCLSGLGVSSDRARAVQLAKERMEEAGRSGAPEASAGQFDGADGGFSWRTEVRPVPQQGDSKISEIVVTVWCGNGGAAYSLATRMREDRDSR